MNIPKICNTQRESGSSDFEFLLCPDTEPLLFSYDDGAGKCKWGVHAILDLLQICSADRQKFPHVIFLVVIARGAWESFLQATIPSSCKSVTTQSANENWGLQSGNEDLQVAQIWCHFTLGGASDLVESLARLLLPQTTEVYE